MQNTFKFCYVTSRNDRRRPGKDKIIQNKDKMKLNMATL